MKSALLGPVVAALVVASCADPLDPLVIKQFQLRDEKHSAGDDPMVRMEKQRRLHGAVSMEERRARLGQYYTLLWNDPKGAGTGPVEVVLEYRQGGSGSRVKQMTASFPAEDASGRASFAVTGDDYFLNGRVTAWRATLRRGGNEVAVRHSYLWR